MTKPAKNALPERDPRNDPHPGDVLIAADGKWRRVGAVTPAGYVCFKTQAGRQGECRGLAWQEWCRKNRVQVHR